MLEHKGDLRPSDEEILYAQKDRFTQAHSQLLHSAKISAYLSLCCQSNHLLMSSVLICEVPEH